MQLVNAPKSAQTRLPVTRMANVHVEKDTKNVNVMTVMLASSSNMDVARVRPMTQHVVDINVCFIISTGIQMLHCNCMHEQ